MILQYKGRMTDWLKTPPVGTRDFGGVGSSPTPINFRHSYETYCCLHFAPIQLVSVTLMHAIDVIIYKQDGRVV